MSRSIKRELRRSGATYNFQGFTLERASEAVRTALPNLTEPLRRELASKVVRTRFAPVEGCAQVWSKTFEVGGEPFTVYAVQVSR